MLKLLFLLGRSFSWVILTNKSHINSISSLISLSSSGSLQNFSYDMMYSLIPKSRLQQMEWGRLGAEEW